MPREEGWSIVQMNGWYVQKVGVILHMVELKNCQTYCNKTLLIMAVEKGEDINWASVFPRFEA